MPAILILVLSLLTGQIAPSSAPDDSPFDGSGPTPPALTQITAMEDQGLSAPAFGLSEPQFPCDDEFVPPESHFFSRFFAAYYLTPSSGSDPPPRRALPGPFPSPPFPTSEYQGFPLVGVPVDTTKYPLQQAL